MKILHVEIDDTTYRAARNMAALQGIKPEKLLACIVEKIIPMLNKNDDASAGEISKNAATVANPKLDHTRVKLALSWPAWRRLTDYCQYREERPARLAALLAAMLPAAMLDALNLTSLDYKRQGINLPSIFNSII